LEAVGQTEQRILQATSEAGITFAGLRYSFSIYRWQILQALTSAIRLIYFKRAGILKQNLSRLI
jgi:hypothetical protein